MSTKSRILLGSIAVLIALAVGRYTVPTKVVEITKVVEVEKVVKDKDQKVEKKKKKTTTITEKPNGEKTTIVVEEDQSNKDTATSETATNSSTNETFKEITKASSLSMSLLVGTPVLTSGQLSLIYGIHISKPILGPITLGAFGMTDKTVGFSLGLIL